MFELNNYGRQSLKDAFDGVSNSNLVNFLAEYLAEYIAHDNTPIGIENDRKHYTELFNSELDSQIGERT